jgi:hypothetical protein
MFLEVPAAWSSQYVRLTEVPNYDWFAGCFGTASGNLMGYWDRHGFPNFYTGPTGDGVAPLNSKTSFGNFGIRSLWASKAGLDGRPTNQFGHIDDYWEYYDLASGSDSYESTDPDPYVTANRQEHTPDCIGDFIGLSQKKWTNLNNECGGNIDAFSFVFWDYSGARRSNFVPPAQGGVPVPDIPSGLRAWTNYRGNHADVFSQLADFNPNVPTGQGFSFADLKAEIDAGYPVLIYLQSYGQLFRSLPGMPRANPDMHGMLAYGYYITDSGSEYAIYRDSWGTVTASDVILSPWTPAIWQANLPVRGFIGYHPLPQITNLGQQGNNLTIQWDGPASVLQDVTAQTTTPLHWYVVEKLTSVNPPVFAAVSQPTTDHSLTLTNCCGPEDGFFRVTLLPPGGNTAP